MSEEGGGTTDAASAVAELSRTLLYYQSKLSMRNAESAWSAPAALAGVHTMGTLSRSPIPGGAGSSITLSGYYQPKSTTC